jgi:hypothetical protein
MTKLRKKQNRKKITSQSIITICEGYDGMRKIYQEALRESYKNEVLVYGTISQDKNLEYHKKLYMLWRRMIEAKKVKMREILDLTKENIQYIDWVKQFHNPNHQIKIIPKDLKFRPTTINVLEGDNIIYKNKVAFFSSYNKDLYVIIINNKHLVQIYRDLFEMSWAISKKYL